MKARELLGTYATAMGRTSPPSCQVLHVSAELVISVSVCVCVCVFVCVFLLSLCVPESPSVFSVFLGNFQCRHQELWHWLEGQLGRQVETFEGKV